jgi:hypothetical protein
MKRVITKAVLDMETMEWLPQEEQSYSYEGPWAKADIGGIIGGLFGGASGTETAEQKEEQQFMSTLQQEQGTIFGENQAAQTALNTAWNPIIQGGPYQYGFSAPEDALLTNQIRTEGAQQTTNTINAAELRQQQATGGASSGPTGGNAALEAMASEVEAQQTAASLANEKLAGYSAGRQLFGEATGVKEGEVSANNAPGYASAASGAGEVANAMNKTVDTQNANSLTSKLIGGATAGGITALTGGLGSVAGGGGFGAGVSNAFGGAQ